MSTNMFGQEGIGGTPFPKVFDPAVQRFRPLIIVSPQFHNDESFAVTCARWEANRRLGRSHMLRVTCDSWRDSAGKLWAPNASAPIDIGVLRLAAMPEPWVIGSVDFIVDAERGTVADLMLMPREAFQTKPQLLVPNLYNPNEGQLPAGGGGAQAPGASAPGQSATPLPPAGGGAAR